jgi:hypothetical protein
MQTAVCRYRRERVESFVHYTEGSGGAQEKKQRAGHRLTIDRCPLSICHCRQFGDKWAMVNG